MSCRKLKSLQVESIELTTGNCSGKARRVMDGVTELAEKVQRLKNELAEAHEAITSRDGKLEDLHSQVDEAKAEAGRAQPEAAGKVQAIEQ